MGVCRWESIKVWGKTFLHDKKTDDKEACPFLAQNVVCESRMWSCCNHFVTMRQYTHYQSQQH